MRLDVVVELAQPEVVAAEVIEIRNIVRDLWRHRTAERAATFIYIALRYLLDVGKTPTRAQGLICGNEFASNPYGCVARLKPAARLVSLVRCEKGSLGHQKIHDRESGARIFQIPESSSTFDSALKTH
jgi:hypothetical protein